MLGLIKPAQRFSLCLLDEGEDFVSLWLGVCQWPKTVSGNWQNLDALPGNIMVCSKSLFFEPDDVRIPIVRLPFEAIQSLEAGGKRNFRLVTTQTTKMKDNMVDAPYVVEKGKPSQWKFSLACGQMSDFLPLVHQYLAASRLSHYDREDALQLLALERAKATTFDTSELLDFTERTVYNQPAIQHTPLVKELGRLVITDRRLYFQALNNVTGGPLVSSHPLAGIAAIARRRSALQPIGLELFFVECEPGMAYGPIWASASAFLSFPSEVEREKVYALLIEQPQLGIGLPGGMSAALSATATLEAGRAELKVVTEAWQNNQISNFDYLLFCNFASGRSFSDLTQYPVFPWILADYSSRTLDLNSPASFRDLSKPMGAIDPQRLSVLLRRYREMPREEGMEKPFLYGTHYSCPGYVMFWLVRAAPGHLLRLQNGRFDSADRLFISIGDSYRSATSAPADIKELIPEFFMTNTPFLKNTQQLALGSRQNGKPVGDVELPPWASSPEDFLLKQRAALESPYVSANLHHWLDLIFGFKQKGEAAEAANNVFHHLTYEGAVDISQIADARERHAIECQINEFGQCPKQIFGTPHPRRLTGPSVEEAFELSERCFSGKEVKRRRSGVDGNQSVSVALLNTMKAAIQMSSGADTSNSQGAVNLANLDVANEPSIESQAKNQQPEVLKTPSEISESAPSPQGLRKKSSQAGAAAAASMQRRSSDLLRNRVSEVSGQLNVVGGHLSSMVNSFAKDPAGSFRGGHQAAQSRLRGLFQRPNSTASQGSVPEPSVRETANATDSSAAMPQGKSDAVSLPRLSSTSGDISGADVVSAGNASTQARDEAAEELAAALGSLSYGADLRQPSPPQNAQNGSSEQYTSSPRRERGWWGDGMHKALRSEPLQISSSNAKIAAMACTLVDGNATIFCALKSGALKVFDGQSGAQIRSASLSSMPLTSILVWSEPKTSGHSVVLCGGFDNKVHAYSMDFGNVLGSWDAHDDSVTCLERSDDWLVSASHDGTVKAWSLEREREPWKSSGQPAEVCLETESKVSCMACQEDICVLGCEQGEVEAWHLRDQDRLWQVQVTSQRVSSIQLTPDAAACIVADESGGLFLLDVESSGSPRCEIDVGAGVTSSLTDGQSLLTSSSHQVLLWRCDGQGAKAVIREDPSSPKLSHFVASIACMSYASSGRLMCLAVAFQEGGVSLYRHGS